MSPTTTTTNGSSTTALFFLSSTLFVLLALFPSTSRAQQQQQQHEVVLSDLDQHETAQELPISRPTLIRDSTFASISILGSNTSSAQIRLERVVLVQSLTVVGCHVVELLNVTVQSGVVSLRSNGMRSGGSKDLLQGVEAAFLHVLGCVFGSDEQHQPQEEGAALLFSKVDVSGFVGYATLSMPSAVFIEDTSFRGVGLKLTDLDVFSSMPSSSNILLDSDGLGVMLRRIHLNAKANSNVSAVACNVMGLRLYNRTRFTLHASTVSLTLEGAFMGGVFSAFSATIISVLHAASAVVFNNSLVLLNYAEETAHSISGNAMNLGFTKVVASASSLPLPQHQQFPSVDNPIWKPFLQIVGATQLIVASASSATNTMNTAALRTAFPDYNNLADNSTVLVERGVRLRGGSDGIAFEGPVNKVQNMPTIKRLTLNISLMSDHGVQKFSCSTVQIVRLHIDGAPVDAEAATTAAAGANNNFIYLSNVAIFSNQPVFQVPAAVASQRNDDPTRVKGQRYTRSRHPLVNESDASTILLRTQLNSAVNVAATSLAVPTLLVRNVALTSVTLNDVVAPEPRTYIRFDSIIMCAHPTQQSKSANNDAASLAAAVVGFTSTVFSLLGEDSSLSLSNVSSRSCMDAGTTPTAALYIRNVNLAHLSSRIEMHDSYLDFNLTEQRKRRPTTLSCFHLESVAGAGMILIRGSAILEGGTIYFPFDAPRRHTTRIVLLNNTFGGSWGIAGPYRDQVLPPLIWLYVGPYDVPSARRVNSHLAQGRQLAAPFVAIPAGMRKVSLRLRASPFSFSVFAITIERFHLRGGSPTLVRSVLHRDYVDDTAELTLEDQLTAASQLLTEGVASLNGATLLPLWYIRLDRPFFLDPINLTDRRRPPLVAIENFLFTEIPLFNSQPSFLFVLLPDPKNVVFNTSIIVKNCHSEPFWQKLYNTSHETHLQRSPVSLGFAIKPVMVIAVWVQNVWFNNLSSVIIDRSTLLSYRNSLFLDHMSFERCPRAVLVCHSELITPSMDGQDSRSSAIILNTRLVSSGIVILNSFINTRAALILEVTPGPNFSLFVLNTSVRTRDISYSCAVAPCFFSFDGVFVARNASRFFSPSAPAEYTQHLKERAGELGADLVACGLHLSLFREPFVTSEWLSQNQGLNLMIRQMPTSGPEGVNVFVRWAAVLFFRLTGGLAASTNNSKDVPESSIDSPLLRVPHTVDPNGTVSMLEATSWLFLDQIAFEYCTYEGPLLVFRAKAFARFNCLNGEFLSFRLVREKAISRLNASSSNHNLFTVPPLSVLMRQRLNHSSVASLSPTSGAGVAGSVSFREVEYWTNRDEYGFSDIHFHTGAFAHLTRSIRRTPYRHLINVYSRNSQSPFNTSIIVEHSVSINNELQPVHVNDIRAQMRSGDEIPEVNSTNASSLVESSNEWKRYTAFPIVVIRNCRFTRNGPKITNRQPYPDTLPSALIAAVYDMHPDFQGAPIEVLSTGTYFRHVHFDVSGIISTNPRIVTTLDIRGAVTGRVRLAGRPASFEEVDGDGGDTPSRRILVRNASYFSLNRFSIDQIIHFDMLILRRLLLSDQGRSYTASSGILRGTLQCVDIIPESADEKFLGFLHLNWINETTTQKEAPSTFADLTSVIDDDAPQPRTSMLLRNISTKTYYTNANISNAPPPVELEDEITETSPMPHSRATAFALRNADLQHRAAAEWFEGLDRGELTYDSSSSQNDYDSQTCFDTSQLLVDEAEEDVMDDAAVTPTRTNSRTASLLPIVTTTIGPSLLLMSTLETSQLQQTSLSGESGSPPPGTVRPPSTQIPLGTAPPPLLSPRPRAHGTTRTRTLASAEGNEGSSNVAVDSLELQFNAAEPIIPEAVTVTVLTTISAMGLLTGGPSGDAALTDGQSFVLLGMGGCGTKAFRVASASSSTPSPAAANDDEGTGKPKAVSGTQRSRAQRYISALVLPLQLGPDALAPLIGSNIILVCALGLHSVATLIATNVMKMPAKAARAELPKWVVTFSRLRYPALPIRVLRALLMGLVFASVEQLFDPVDGNRSPMGIILAVAALTGAGGLIVSTAQTATKQYQREEGSKDDVVGGEEDDEPQQQRNNNTTNTKRNSRVDVTPTLSQPMLQNAPSTGGAATFPLCEKRRLKMVSYWMPVALIPIVQEESGAVVRFLFKPYGFWRLSHYVRPLACYISGIAGPDHLWFILVPWVRVIAFAAVGALRLGDDVRMCWVTNSIQALICFVFAALLAAKRPLRLRSANYLSAATQIGIGLLSMLRIPTATKAVAPDVLKAVGLMTLATLSLTAACSTIAFLLQRFRWRRHFHRVAKEKYENAPPPSETKNGNAEEVAAAEDEAEVKKKKNGSTGEEVSSPSRSRTPHSAEGRILPPSDDKTRGDPQQPLLVLHVPERKPAPPHTMMSVKEKANPLRRDLP